MLDFYKGIIPIIDDDPKSKDTAFPGHVGFGLIPRDYREYPEEMFDQPSNLHLIPESELDARFDEQEAQQSSLEHLYLRGNRPAFLCLDQDGHGYCWAYSTGHATMIDRLKANQPMVRLNPHSVAAIVMEGRDQGGWCGLSAKFLREHGIASEEFWPVHSRNLRNDTPECRANMARHKCLEDWVDLTRQVYDQNLTMAQLKTCLFANVPCATDFNWWGHSVCAIRWVRVEPGSWGLLILNSWKDWGNYGLGVLRGSKAICNGALAIRSSGISPT